MNLKLLSWNVRGVNKSTKRKVIKSVIRKQKVDLFCIQETKIQDMTDRVIQDMENGVTWAFTGVYGPFTRLEREWLWEEVGAIRGIWEGPWCLGGDFNITLAQGTEAKLKVWNREEFGNLESNKEAAIQQVEYWDRVEDERSLTMEELACKKEAKEDYAKWVDLEETHWRQRARGRDAGGSFTEGEVQSALMEMNGDKAQALTGFCFLLAMLWDFVKEEILEMFKEFHDQNMFLKSINNTFLVLIPKKGGAEDLGDFRPISLLGGLYKLLAKVLAQRLKKVIGKVVSHDQNAFVTGRQILDSSLIANEVIDNWNKKGDKGVICKLDIEKAYDSINWQFLLKVMEKMGFGAKWLRWMWWCISTAKFSVMVNGTPAGFFSSSKGLRQGDPLSPYLFVMGMEVLSVLIRRAMEGAASGLRINLAKSEIIPVGEVQRIEELAVELGCRVGQLPTVYLGLPWGCLIRLPMGGMG
ncbi:Transposon TX1 uncharacterized 149 kDa protein [Vitis vinifera]|uniref:Transposon TX1 uncharacterized 149 kDa protein n=1 Tax=Vitis vinifera TaxID=29760 RepID=A0A438GXD9_VITVI|nr:Transposon TX1 uncharacterized 149 kDa protein [Vitis vinifera]